MKKDFSRYFGNFRNADLYIKAFYTFIKIIIYFLIFFKANIVLNYKTLIYLNIF